MKLSVIRAIAFGGSVVCQVVSAGSSGAPLFAEDGVPTIRQQVLDKGDFERLVVTAENELQLADLVMRSDLIVESLNAGSKTYLDEGNDSIYTDYNFTVDTIVKNKRRFDLRVGHTVIVRRENGAVTLDGGTAEVHENGFPPFNPNERYLLFLTEQAAGVYSVLGGAQGAFVAGDSISPMRLQVGVTEDESPAVPRAAFFGDVQALLKFAGQ